MKLKKNDTIDLFVSIRGNLTTITFTFLGSAVTFGGVQYYQFISNTLNPYKANMTLKALSQSIPSASVPCDTLVIPETV